MHIPRKIAALAGPALVVAALGSGVAYAATPTTSAPVVTHSTHVADTTGGPQVGGVDKTGAAEPAETTAEHANVKAAHETDGHGGHADTGGGNVDHQFNGTE